MRLLFLFFLLFSSAFSNEKVILQLKWFHQFQFAGYYAAKEKGFYKDLGLDVEIRQRDLKYNNIEQVIDNKAQYGVADSILMLYKSNNEPVVIVSPIFQHSPSIIYSLKSSGLNSPYKLENKDLIFYPNDTDGFAVLAMLKKLGVKPNLIRKRTKNDYLKVMNQEVDLAPGYLTNEIFYFKERNVEVNIINPSNYGFDLYGDMLFTNEYEMKNHPQRVKRFKEATLKGWEYALNNKDEIIELIHNKYNNSKSIAHLKFEADAIEKLIGKDLIPLGTIDEGRVKYISELYNEHGLVSKTFDVKEFIFKDYNEEKTVFKNSSLGTLTVEEKNFLKKHPEIRFRVQSNKAPFEFVKDGKPVGIAVDYVRQSARNMGLNIKFVVNDDNIKTVYDNMKNDRENYDTLLYGVKSPKKEKEFSFSKHYLSYPMMIITHKDNSYISSLKDLINKTIALEEGYLTNNWVKRDYPGINIINVKDTYLALKLVNDGKVDAYVGNTAIANYMSVFEGMDNIKVSAPSRYGNIKFSFIAPKQWPELTSILEKGYNKITPPEHIALQQKWFSIQTVDKTDYTLIKKILFGFVIVMLVFLLWNRQIIKEKNKTKDALEKLELAREKELKQQEIILNQSKIASMGEMIGNIAHQWRQPLSVISTSASGMQLQKEMGVLKDSDFYNNTDLIIKNSQYLSDTIDTFRSYLKDNKKHEKIVLQEVINKAISLVDVVISSNNIKLIKNLDDSKPINYYLSSGELIQIIINLITNSKDALIQNKIKNPFISIKLIEDSDKIVISIYDNAGGVPQEVMPKIFDPYFTTKHQSQGTGLGLHMSYKIITESFNGQIYAKNIDDGVMFSIELPLLK